MLTVVPPALHFLALLHKLAQDAGLVVPVFEADLLKVDRLKELDCVRTACRALGQSTRSCIRVSGHIAVRAAKGVLPRCPSSNGLDPCALL